MNSTDEQAFIAFANRTAGETMAISIWLNALISTLPHDHRQQVARVAESIRDRVAQGSGPVHAARAQAFQKVFGDLVATATNSQTQDQ